MNTSYKCRNFELHELVDPSTFYKFENRPDILWQKFDERVLKDLDHLRDLFGICTINDWFWGGKFRWSGLRPKDCIIGADFSDHKDGKAFDLKFEDYHANQIKEYICNHHEDLEGITAIESKRLATSWTHVAHRNWNTDLYGILIIEDSK